MSARATSHNGAGVTVHVPLELRRSGGRKRIVTPEGAASWRHPAVRIDSTLVKALARAHRWQRMLESGEFGSVAELARAERINASYVARVLRLTLLAPEIVEAVVDGRHDRARLTLDGIMKPFAVEWQRQEAALVQHARLQ